MIAYRPHSLLLFCCLLLTLPARAEQTFSHSRTPPLLVELYTSEGCSSCPPADRYLSRFIHNPELWQEVIPMAFHVDYWDYIGWPDRFAQPEYKQRQYDYRRSGRSRSVYTPGWFVNGQEWRGFFSNRPLPAALQHAGGELEAVLQADNRLQVRYKAETKNPRLTAHVVLLGFDRSSEVTAGENRGKQLQHQFVVLEKQQQSATTPHWQFNLPISRENQRQALAIWITQGELELLQATGGWINPNR